MENVEALHYINKVNFRAKIPYLGRENSIRFIDSLYDKDAMSVEVLKTDDYFITSIAVRFQKKDTRKILNQIFKSKPTGIIETTHGRLRIGYKTICVEWQCAWRLDDKDFDD